MMAHPRTVALWRAGIVLYAALALAEFTIEAVHAPRGLTPGVAGTALFKGSFVRERGPTTFVVESLPEGSPLVAAGVGDRIRYARPLGRWDNVVAGDHVALTILHEGASRAIDVVVPPARALPRHAVSNYVVGMAGSLASLLLGVLIGWRRPDRLGLRALAVAGVLFGWVYPYSAPAGAHVEWLDFIASVSIELGGAALLVFALNYPDDRPSGWRAKVKPVASWIAGVVFVAAVVFFGRLYAGFFEPAASWVLRASPVVLPALFLWAMLLAWRSARGESRMRMTWIVATLGTIVGASLVGTLDGLAGYPIPIEDMALALNVCVLAAEMVIVYSILRHRIFDFGFVANRTLVFGIVGAILLGSFQLAHAVAADFLHFDDRNRTALLSAVLAVAVYLSFNKLKALVEKGVDRVFFSAWAAKEDDLRQFVSAAKHATDERALTALFIGALERFTACARCAVYLRDDAGGYLRSAGAPDALPEAVGRNHEAVLAMLAHGKAHRVRVDAGAAALLALPMSHRRELVGFVLLGSRPDGEPYRPDQVDALERATHEIGLDFHALAVERLEQEVLLERKAAEVLRGKLDAVLALAKDAATRQPT
jgi:hypothetical protein